MKNKSLFYALIVALSIATFAAAQSNPTLSETEQLKIQVLNLQYALRAEQDKTAQCQTAVLKFVTQEIQQEINAGHPEFNFDITTGQFTPKKEPVEKK